MQSQQVVLVGFCIFKLSHKVHRDYNDRIAVCLCSFVSVVSLCETMFCMLPYLLKMIRKVVPLPKSEFFTKILP